MPIVKNSSFKKPFYLFNRHVETILPSVLRNVVFCYQKRIRITTDDADFLDVDFSSQQSKKIIILSHGLEGNSKSSYMRGMAKLFFNQGFDVIAWNNRGCSGQDNNLPITYHSGKTEDLNCVIQFAIQHFNDASIFLIGFSMGANVTLKYLGEGIFKIPHQIKGAMVISPPCNLGGSADQLHKGFNRIYENRFLKTLTKKLKAKALQFPNTISALPINKMKTIRELDQYFTAPINGFKNAELYYSLNSSDQFIPKIKIRTLILMAENDPFLSPSCYPIDACLNHQHVYLEITKKGGHLGFFSSAKIYYHEKRALEFLTENN